jgi:hypothetical protein
MRPSMKRLVAVVIGLGFGGAVGIGSAAIADRGLGRLPGPPARYERSVPSMPRDNGVGERLMLVVRDTYATQAEAEDANLASQESFGDVQGYYVAPVDSYLGLRDEATTGDWALLSAFRTQQGAEEFAAAAQSLGEAAQVVGPVLSLGGPYAGLGQEEDPGGQGPLTDALPLREQAALR